MITNWRRAVVGKSDSCWSRVATSGILNTQKKGEIEYTCDIERAKMIKRKLQNLTTEKLFSARVTFLVI